MDKNNR